MPSFLIIIAVIAVSVCRVAHADERQHDRGMLRVGAFLGGGLVDWVGKDADGSRPEYESIAKPGFSAGLLATLDLSRLFSLDMETFHLAVQPEISYATKGAGVERNGEEDRGSFDLSYLQSGLLVRIDYAVTARVNPYLLVGPELGFLLAAQRRNILGDTSDIKDNLKSTDIGLVMGLGAMYSLPPWGALGLELRADLGLVSIDGQGDGDEIRNAALSLLLAYLY
jgi:opacity protein-like surface antigen